MARPKKTKEALQKLPDMVVSPEDKTTAENKEPLNETRYRPVNSFEEYVKKVIKEIKQTELAKKFKKSVELHGSKKITIRVDRDVLEFYESQPLDCTTAMKKALRIVMDAVHAQNIKF